MEIGRQTERAVSSSWRAGLRWLLGLCLFSMVAGCAQAGVPTRTAARGATSTPAATSSGYPTSTATVTLPPSPPRGHVELGVERHHLSLAAPTDGKRDGDAVSVSDSVAAAHLYAGTPRRARELPA